MPKGKAPIADVDGRISIEDGERFWKITLTPDDGAEEIVYEKLSKRQWLAMTVVDGQERPLADGDHVHVGSCCSRARRTRTRCCGSWVRRGAAAPGARGAEGVPDAERGHPRQAHRGDRPADAAPGHDLDSGATDFLPGALAERADFEVQNRRVVAEAASPPPVVRC